MYNPLDTIPPQPPPAVAKKSAELDRLTLTAAELGEKVAAAEAAVTAAEATDAAAYATAIRAGRTGDPGTPTADRARKGLAEVERRRDATEVARAEVAAELSDAVDTATGAWSDTTDRRAQDAAAALGIALADAGGALDDLLVALGTRAWLADRSRRYRPARAFTAVKALNDDPYEAALLLAAVEAWRVKATGRAEALA